MGKNYLFFGWYPVFSHLSLLVVLFFLYTHFAVDFILLADL